MFDHIPYVFYTDAISVSTMRFLLTLFVSNILFSQVRVGEWDAFTSPLDIADMMEMDSLIVCATDGGILTYDRDLDQLSTFTKMHGLISTDLAAIDMDSHGQYWVGGANPNGFIQIFDGSFHLLESIDLDLTEIVEFSLSDTIAFAAFQQNQNWGIIEFHHDGEQYFYKDVYNNWPVTLNEISGLVLDGETLYVGTDQGLYSGNWKSTNLKDPSNWNLVGSISGDITVFRQIEDVILFIMGNVVYEYDITSGLVTMIWDHYEDSYDINDIVKDSQGNYWAILNSIFFKIGSTDVEWSRRTGESFNRVFSLKDGTIVSGTTTGLLFLNEDRSFMRIKPNTLLMNNISAIEVLDDGRLIAGSNKGIMVREAEGWRNIIGIDGDDLIINESKDYSRFVADTLPIDFGDYISDIEEGDDGLIYVGVRGTYPKPRRHGGGIVVIDIDDPSNFTLIDTNHLDYFADEYLIVRDIKKDGYGNLWIADTYATTNYEPLKVLTTDGNWGAYDVTGSGGVMSLTPNVIDIDSWGRIWIGSFEDNNNIGGAANGGLAMLDYTGDPADPTETEWKSMNVNSDASTNTVWSLGINSNDVLYTLSPNGLTGLSLQFSNNDPVSHYGYNYYPNISFSSGSKLRIDPRDNVWTCSPTQGVYVLTSSATYWPDINGITAENSYLLSNNVASMAFDEKNGLAYIATDRGISSLKIPFAKKRTSYSNVEIFPSPFRIPSDTPMTIQGLMDNSSCMIMTLTGRVLRTINTEMETDGYQAFWDGKDKSGNWVETGVYLIAVNDDKGSSSFEKIAVIRN